MYYENVIIRNAIKSDIKNITTLKINGWKTAYIDIIDSEYLDSIDIDKEVEKYSNYSLDNIFVAELNNEIVGFCRIYDYDKSPYEDKNIDCEIREIYVEPDLKRKGIGSQLFNYVMKYFKNKGKNKLYIGVFEDNYKSRKFYEKMGEVLGDKTYLTINGKSYSVISYTYNLK